MLAAATSIPASERYYLLLLLIVLLGVFGAIMVVLLLGAWRKRLVREQRLEQRRQERQATMTDIWQAGADRVAAESDDQDADESR